METTQKSQTRAARLGRHLSRNLVGYVALFIAVSLTPLPSYAANMAIGTKGIKNGAVTTPKLANNAVKPAKIAANAVGNAKIANNAVNSPKIADGSVQKGDLAAAARGYTKVVTKILDSAGVTSGSNSGATVTCAAGGVAIGGGGYALPTGLAIPGSTFGELKVSAPMMNGDVFDFTAGDNVSPDSWKTTITNTLADTTTVRHYAICAFK